MMIKVQDTKLKPGYKQTEIGMIPNDWVAKTLEEIADKERPICYGIVQTGKRVADGVPCIRVVDLNDGKINKKNLITTTKDISNSYKRTILKEDDLVIALRGKIGELAIIDKELIGANLTRGVALIAIHNSLDSSFFLQQLSSYNSKIIFEKYLNGSALQEIPILVLRKILVAYPPTKSEQTAIATVLSDIDSLIESLEKLIAKKRDIKQATMQQLLTGKRRLPGFGREQKPAYKQTEVGVIPEDWKVKKVGDICDFVVPGRNKPKNFDGDIPWITTPDIEGNIVTVSKRELYVTKEEAKRVGSKIVTRNSVVMSCVGDLGLVTIAGRDIVINQQLHAFLPNETINPYYLRYTLIRRKNYMESVATKTAVPYMNKDNCNSVPIPVPAKAEQQAIATILSDIDTEIAALEQKLDKTRALKQGMMQELLTGKTRLI